MLLNEQMLKDIVREVAEELESDVEEPEVILSDISEVSESQIDDALLAAVDVLKVTYEMFKENRTPELKSLFIDMVNAAGDAAEANGVDMEGKTGSVKDAAQFFESVMSRLPSTAVSFAREVIDIANQVSQPAMLAEGRNYGNQFTKDRFLKLAGVI